MPITKTHDLGRAFWYPIRVKAGTPLTHRWTTYLGQPPYYWSKSLIVRISKKRALVLGWWRNAPAGLDEVDLALRAINGKVRINGNAWQGQHWQSGGMHERLAAQGIDFEVNPTQPDRSEAG